MREIATSRFSWLLCERNLSSVPPLSSSGGFPVPRFRPCALCPSVSTLMLASWSSSYCNSVSGRRLEHVLTVCPQPSSLGSPVFELLFSSASSSAPVRLKTFTQRWGALLHSLSRALPCWAMYAMFMSVTRRGIATLHIIIKRAGRFATVFRSDVFLIHSHSIDPSVVPQLLEPTGHLNVVVVAGQRTATSPLHALATRLQLVHSSRPALHRSFHHLQPREMESWTQGAYVVRVPNRAQVSAAITKHLHIVCLRLTSSSCQRPSTFDLNDADSQLLALMGEVEARTSSALSLPTARGRRSSEHIHLQCAPFNPHLAAPHAHGPLDRRRHGPSESRWAVVRRKTFTHRWVYRSTPVLFPYRLAAPDAHGALERRRHGHYQGPSLKHQIDVLQPRPSKSVSTALRRVPCCTLDGH